MSYNDIFNRPYFVVPPDCPQVQLLFDRAGNHVAASGWQAKDEEAGAVRFSLAVYFGTLVMHPEQAGDDEGRLRAALGFPEDCLLRLDYACTADALYLLRAGQPGSEPATFADLGEDAVAAGERFIGAFLALDFRSVLLGRRIEDMDVDYLFAGEEMFYEGFLGEEGVPLTRPASPSPQAFAISDTMLVTIP